jgi:predicted secreted protein
MNIGGSIVVILIAWWIAFQALLPIGVRSPAEEGVARPGDPGAPMRGNFLMKSLWSAVIAIIVWGILFAIVHWSGLTFADIPSLY